MVRTFTTGFTNRLLKANTKPYLVLEIEWGGPAGIQYYIDRTQDSFSASGARVPSSGVSDCLVKSWGSIETQLKEMWVSAQDSYEFELEDRNGEITAILGGQVDPFTGRIVEQQKKTVKVYRMFDESDVVWPTDAALIWVGTTKAHVYSEPDNSIKLTVTEPARMLLGTVGCAATADVFLNIPEDSDGKNIPLCWGKVERVEAVLVSKPWEVHTLEAIDLTLAKGKSYAISERVADINAIPGVLYPARLISGSLTDALSPNEDGAKVCDVVMSFVPSGSPATPDRVQISSSPPMPNTWSAVINSVVGSGPDAQVVILGSSISPPFPISEFADETIDLDGAYCQITRSDGKVIACYVNNDDWASGPSSLNISFEPADVGDQLRVGQAITFFRDFNGGNAIYMAGSTIAQQGDWVYAANALPSKQIYKVEGYGSVADDSTPAGGSVKKDYVLLADTYGASLLEDASVGTTAGSSYWHANLNDARWNLGSGGPGVPLAPNDLGRNLTTITFPGNSPRYYYPQLDDNRIWVTLGGVEDVGDSTGAMITNPALILLKYLESPYTFNLDFMTYVNITAFENAAVALSSDPVAPGLYDYVAGFAQIEQQDGLTLLQDIARQCRSVFYMDQGKFSMQLLKNDPSGWAATYNESNILERSVTSIAEDDTDDVVTRLAANWTYRWGEHDKPRKVLAINFSAEWDLGANYKEIDVYLYNDRGQAKAETVFWLTRWSRIWRTVKFTTFSKALILQPGDWIKISYRNGDGRYLIPADTLAEVQSVKDAGPQGLFDIVCRYVKFRY